MGLLMDTDDAGPAWPAPQHTQSGCSGDLEKGFLKGGL